ncbi:hypothetical protein Q5692_13920 [Microcoleus sp. C2C3]|uniref:hypothetical protein n=1 Tax=unclassified Microcoleus TaxID=2642155 RepID=UPI002FCE8C9E
MTITSDRTPRTPTPAQHQQQQSAIVVTASANPTSPAAIRHRMRVRQWATTPDTSYPPAGKTLDQREHSGKK